MSQELAACPVPGRAQRLFILTFVIFTCREEELDDSSNGEEEDPPFLDDEDNDTWDEGKPDADALNRAVLAMSADAAARARVGSLLNALS